MDYYLYDGVYYRPFGGSYYVCRPPFGVSFVPSVSASALSILHFAFFASVANGYNTINENAAIITEQNAVIAQNNATIASQNEALALNSNRAARSYNLANRLGLVQSYASAQTEYFYDDGVFFVKSADGRYLTIVPPAGALVRELPDDYDEITIEDNIYYKVDDTVYRATVVDGSLYFEVLGQLTGELAARYRLN